MTNLLARLAQTLRPIGGYPDVVVAIKCHHQAVSMAEFRQIGESFGLVNSASIGLPRPIDHNHIGHSHDMLAESLRILKDKAAITATDAVVVMPAALMPFRIITLPYLSAKELSREAKEPDFWSELEPDLSKYHNPLIRYTILHSSENDDITRVLLSFAEDHVVQPWIDMTLAGHFNPVFLENELLALANLRLATLAPPEQRNAQLILHLHPKGCACIAIEGTRLQVVKLEISDFDLILIEQAEEAADLGGEFWQDIVGRLANTVKQAILYLQEEHDFQPFATLNVTSELPRCQNIIPPLKEKLDLVNVRFWNPFDEFQMTTDQASMTEQYANPSLMASAIGSAMQKVHIYSDKNLLPFSINMLPQADILRKNRQLRILSQSMIRLMMLMVILFGSFTSVMILPSYFDSVQASRHVEDLQNDAERMDIQVKSMANNNARLRQDMALMKAHTQASTHQAFLLTLPDLIPEDTELDEITITPESNVHISGFVRNSKAITQLKSDLLQHGLLENIEIETKPQPPYQHFRITGKLATLQ
jgi:Tfp pilus assembly PilM family ATPase